MENYHLTAVPHRSVELYCIFQLLTSVISIKQALKASSVLCENTQLARQQVCHIVMKGITHLHWHAAKGSARATKKNKKT